MSKFCSQQLPVCKVIPPSGYGSRKSALLSSGLMGWFSWVLSVFLIGLGIALPVHADEDCKPINVAFKEWCKWQYSEGGNKVTDYGNCMQECYVIMEMYPRQDFKQECLAVGGKFDENDKVTPTCHFDRSPTQDQNQPPQANFTTSPSEGPTPLTVALDGKGSTDDGSIASYQWSTSDGKTASGSTASFVFDKEGAYTITLTVTDNDGLTGSAQQSVTVKGSEFKVVSVTSKYPEGTHFLDGLDHDVTYTAEIDWKGLEPFSVSFITPSKTEEVFITGNTAEQTFNMGKDFGVCGKLKVVATSKDGTKSPEKEADFVTMSKPRENLIFVRIGEDTGGFSYSLSLGGVNIDFFDLLAESAGEDPMLHETPLRLKLIPTVAITVDSSKGETKMEMDWENFNLSGEKEFKVGSFEAELHPTINVNGKFESCEWKWGGDVGVSGSGSFKASTLIGAFPIGPVPAVPIYCKFTISAGAEGSLSSIEKIEPFTAKGEIGVSLNGRGSVGAGFDEVVAIEGWVELGGKLGWKWKLPPSELSNPTEGTVTDRIGMTAVALAWKWEGEIINCEWEYVTHNGKGECSSPFIRSRHTTNPTLIERDYLAHPNYGTFRKSMRERRDSQPVSLQQAVYPYSDADTSGNQNALYATWLSDNSARSAVNRTQVVFSTWNGTDWTNPQPIADDGTADFHPKILAFGDNSALATWEDTKTTLADTAQLEDMLQAMEISVSSYNPQTQQWTGTQRLTDNTFMDRSPKLAGKTTGNAIVTWISNAANDIMGSADKPNQLWYARYANNSWNTPQQVANIPYPILKYNTVFDGQNGYVVLSVDTDGDLTTIEDHELFQLTLTNGVWSALTRLTTDTLADDNPQLGLDPNGQVVLTWLKNNEISSVVNFDLNTRTVVRTDDSGYSSNLADFKLAQATDGKLAIVWAEPSAEHSSDLHALFYNPTGNVWGGLRQLTADSETEKRITATFFGTDTLVALYNRNQVGDVSTSTSPTTSPKVDTPVAVYTDLYMLKHTLRAIDFTKIDLPELGAIEGDTFAFDPAGNLTDTQAILSGGISVNGGPFKNLITFQDNLEHGEDAEPVTLKGIIIPDPKHDGKPADIFAFGEYTPYGDDLNDTTCPTQVANSEAVPFYVMESLPKNYVTWEGTKTPSSIPAFLYKNVLLKSGEAQEFILFEGPFDARGCLSISFGYRLQDSGVVVYNHHTATVDNGIGVTVRKK